MKKLSILSLMLVCITGLFAQPCSKLFISEYVEGSGNNKALEIYNPTASAISLSGYKLIQYNNNNDSAFFTFNLNGTVGAYDVYVIANSQSQLSGITSVADTLTGNSVMSFNGNDVIAFLSPTNDTLDRIGRISDLTSYYFGTDSFAEHTAVRLASVQEGTKNWAIGTNQWTVYDQNEVYLGNHVSTCTSITDTLVSFSQNSGTVSEDAGTFSIPLQLNATSGSTTFGVSVALIGGTGSAADINNYTTQTVSFSPGIGNETVIVTITNDAVTEGPETFIFKLQNPTGGASLGSDSIYTLTIGPSDIAAVTYNISQVTGLDTSFRPDSLNVVVRVTGTVYGINNRATGAEFFIHDATDGIQVFSPASSFGYTVAEGDNVQVEATVGFFNGVTQLTFVDTIIKTGTGTVPTPVVVQDLDESTEAELVRLNNVYLVNPSQWNLSAPSGFNVDVTDGNGNWIVRIDEQTDIFTTSMAAPSGNFDVMGIGSQFDGSAPYNSGYQILPRRKTDIILLNSIDKNDNNIARIFPNPNSGSFAVELNEQGIETEVRVVSLTGAVVYTVKSADKTVMVNTSGLSAGLYIVEATSANKVSRSKVQIN